VTRAANGESEARFSIDGLDWSSSVVPEVRATGDSDLAGDARGAVAVRAGAPNHILVTRDCRSWRDINVADSDATIEGLAAYRGTFIAVGRRGGDPSWPMAWWSTDGRDWNVATVEAKAGGSFRAVHAGARGLVARGAGDFGSGSYWTSPDGRVWNVSAANPAERPEGPDPILALTADGSRLLGQGSSGSDPDGRDIDYWTSFDGVSWGQLEVSGPERITRNWAIQPFLLRDGVLFNVGQGEPTPAWLGVARS